jgi:hypothetical protein
MRYADRINADACHYTVSKKSHLFISSPVSAEQQQKSVLVFKAVTFTMAAAGFLKFKFSLES